VTRPASPGRYLAKTAAIADRDCCCQGL